tara:strand:+ start:477 stop:806 length:330 start_codon:yes stop_codon:yes gene_type:complete
MSHKKEHKGDILPSEYNAKVGDFIRKKGIAKGNKKKKKKTDNMFRDSDNDGTWLSRLFKNMGKGRPKSRKGLNLVTGKKTKTSRKTGLVKRKTGGFRDTFLEPGIESID